MESDELGIQIEGTVEFCENSKTKGVQPKCKTVRLTIFDSKTVYTTAATTGNIVFTTENAFQQLFSTTKNADSTTALCN